ncbi:unnamed protein product [Rhizoctonia solani]|uniref:NADH:flavin oxidoreductase/NADH oxidase N-terminal domain-containing protein n=1 Tax=Rhizoctonia solani TaxID=456999 RepID=A0A8H3AJX8_9AGAM|nr:unnamed protein product [Rhizoctonia solani]
MNTSSSKLFTPLPVGAITLSHRVVMAPLTRFRADHKHAPTELNVQYYAQRAEIPGTFLITEATAIAPEAAGYDHIPGIWSDEQIEAWKRVTDAVHERHSYIYLQLWALGRAAEPKVLAREGLPFVSASPTPIEEGGPVPRALTEDEIKNYVQLYAQAANNAVFKAGFDGVEIHSANGYLPDQFLQYNSNKRTDKYGGSIENRARFLLEVADSVTSAIGANKTGIRLSPWNTFQGKCMRMQDPIPTFSYVLKEFVQRYSELAYVHFVEPVVQEKPTQDVQATEPTESNDFARKIWGPRPFFSAGGYDPKRGEEAANKYENTAIVFGRYFISNPDLPERLRKGVALTHYDRDTFYSPGPKGYIDYPKASEVQA